MRLSPLARTGLRRESRAAEEIPAPVGRAFARLRRRWVRREAGISWTPPFLHRLLESRGEAGPGRVEGAAGPGALALGRAALAFTLDAGSQEEEELPAR